MFMNESKVRLPVHDLSTENEFVVEPVSRLNPWPVNWEPFLHPINVMDPNTQSEFLAAEQMCPSGNAAWSTTQGDQSAACPTSQNLAKWDAINEMSKEMDPLLDPLIENLLEKFLQTKCESGARSSASACDASESTAASSVDGDVVRELLLPKGMFEDAHNSEPDSSPSCMQPSIAHDQACPTSVPNEDLEKDMSGTLKINLTYSLGMWSVGSARHATGDCKPCGFLWKKGCHKAQNCEFCHLCPADEVKKRKRDKIAALQRAEADAAEQKMWECGDDEQPMSRREPRVIPPLPK